ncbi:RNA polymerase sigma factor [Halorientalis halophila]|uniref:RNA polymerase sigma factor n=1 Tax=Halorientalis halophila TaxID=3108499 RepID=UPI00300A462F
MTGRQPTLFEFERPEPGLQRWDEDLDTLTDAEREVFQAVELGAYGAREYARHTDRSPGTVSNLLRRARGRLEDGGQT